MKRLPRAAFAALILCWCWVAAVGTPPLAAQPTDKRADAERFFRAGEQAYNAGQYLTAAQAFEQAYELLPLPAIVFSTAQAYRLQYFIDKDPTRLKRAIDLYRVYVDKVTTGGRREDAVTSLAELEPILSRIEAETSTRIEAARVAAANTQLMVSTQVAGARAFIGDASGEAPFIREVAPGEHVIRVEAVGYFPAEQRAVAVAGRFISVEVPLTAKPARLTVRAEGGAKVSVDGRTLATTPLTAPLDLPAGKHFVSVMRNGRRPFARELSLARGEAASLEASLVPTSQRRASRLVLYGGGVLFVGALTTGLLAWKADATAADILEQRNDDSIDLYDLDAYNDARGDRNSFRRATYLFLGLGTATVATALALYLFDEPSADGLNMGMGMGMGMAPEDSRTAPPALDAGPEGEAPGPAELAPMSEVTPRPTRLVPALLPEGVGLVVSGGF